jgi:hypothetical protein
LQAVPAAGVVDRAMTTRSRGPIDPTADAAVGRALAADVDRTLWGAVVDREIAHRRPGVLVEAIAATPGRA